MAPWRSRTTLVCFAPGMGWKRYRPRSTFQGVPGTDLCPTPATTLASLLAGLGLIVGATFASHKFNLPASSTSALLLPTAIAVLVAGMFLLIARRNAIAMVLGYIMMENGIYLVGTTFSVQALHIVEFGILLDVLAGVMIMAIILQNIKQALDDVDTALLRTLKE